MNEINHLGENEGLGWQPSSLIYCWGTLGQSCNGSRFQFPALQSELVELDGLLKSVLGISKDKS